MISGNTGIVPISPDTYMVSAETTRVYHTLGELKARLIGQANEFAASKGRVAIPISTKETDASPFNSVIKFEYQFRVVDKNDPEAKRTAIVPRADIVIEKKESISADLRREDLTARPADLYTELTKLDDLRKKGIITDAEFDAQKKKLLEKN